MSATTPSNTYLQRLIGAISLDPAIYEEVEADRAATGQALVTVACSGLAAGLGARGFAGTSPLGVVFVAVVTLIAWAAWALLTFEIGGRLMPEPQTKVDVGEMLRTIGFASAPGILRIFGVLPGVTIPAFAITAVWMLAAMVVGVRQALDYTSTPRAIAVCLVGWVLALVIAVVAGLIFGPTLR